MAPGQVEVKIDVSTGQAATPMGPIGKEFSGLTRLMIGRDNNPPLIRNYLQTLSKIRTRFNQIKNQGDNGPASRQLMQQTLEGSSELSDSLKLVEEQMLNGQTDAAKATLRPLLVRPLVQSFAVIVPAAENEINRVWTAQVYDPFQRTLAGKYPFDKASRLEATAGEMSKMFGPEGSVAKFSTEALSALVVRRGDTITPRTWADIGLQLRPEFSAGFPAWVAPIAGQGGAAGSSAAAGGAGSNEPQTNFQMLPTPVPGMAEYTIEVDGQQLRYRNAVANWVNFVWPGQGAPGVKISGITTDGRAVEFLNEPGGYGLEKMISKAKRRKLDTGAFELTWPNGALAVTVQLRLISSPNVGSPTAQGAPDTPSASGGLKGVQLPALVVGSLGAAPPVAAASGGKP
jgi:type VI secretion system protein ImpL